MPQRENPGQNGSRCAPPAGWRRRSPKPPTSCEGSKRPGLVGL
jgi:hypothetical protein